MSVQTTYGDNIPVGYAGAQANMEPAVMISRTVEEANGLAFGVAVMQGSDDKGVIISDGTKFLGITVREQSVDPSTPNKFAKDDTARIATKGVFWIANSGGVTAGQPAKQAANGKLIASSSSPIPGARWDTTAADGELALLRLA